MAEGYNYSSCNLLSICFTMKKFVFAAAAIALSTVALTARADWTLVEGSPADPKLYVDNETVEKSGPNMLLLWQVIDHGATQTRSGKDFRSEMLRYEYDCEKSMFREMFRSWHKGPMATSTTVYWTEGQRQWLAPEPGSIDEMLTRAACASRK